jgi:beta-lactamase class A
MRNRADLDELGIPRTSVVGAVKSVRRIIIRCLLSVILMALGWYAHVLYYDRFINKPVKIIKSSSYTLTSPLLDIELPQGVMVNQEPIPFKHIIEGYVTSQVDGKSLSRVAVYYRNLQDGPWFGINEEYRFIPASMIKVPVMIAWLKRAERDPAILKRRLLYDGKVDATRSQHFKPAASVKAGQSYTVDELLQYMVNHSDNNAYEVLNSNLKPEEIMDVFAGMGVPSATEPGEYSISAHAYSSFFRCLYNATYLSREMSEKALKILCSEDFPKGIISGVPKGTVVASKFGEWVKGPRGEEKQLHEFGIVYHPVSGPYLLGIMTQGNDFAKQIEVISDVSELVYDANGTTTKKYH